MDWPVAATIMSAIIGPSFVMGMRFLAQAPKTVHVDKAQTVNADGNGSKYAPRDDFIELKTDVKHMGKEIGELKTDFDGFKRDLFRKLDAMKGMDNPFDSGAFTSGLHRPKHKTEGESGS